MVYDPAIQTGVAAAGYYRNPENLEEYKQKSTFLPKLNNEIGKETTEFAKH